MLNFSFNNMKKRLFSRIIFTLVLAIQSSAFAHDEDLGVMKMDEFRRPSKRVNLQIPNIPGYLTLKCDFHMHTVFSDGLVWPTIRLQEAWEEGLDAICITDHIEYQPHAKNVPTQHNRAYELLKDIAPRSNILLIHGSEITRGTPPGHFNAMFINDASDFVTERGTSELDKAAIDKAAEQKAFIFWNHPGWKVDSVEGSYEWIPFVDEIQQEGKLHGIEVFNGFGFHKKALDWCIDKGLTVMGTSDIHNLTAHDYDFKNGRTRSMTLLFAKERSVEGVREALESARTLAWSSEYLAGPEALVKALFEASMKVGPVFHTDADGVSYLEITNESDIGYELVKSNAVENSLPETIHLYPQSTQVISSSDLEEQLKKTPYIVINTFVRSDQHLSVTLSSK